MSLPHPHRATRPLRPLVGAAMFALGLLAIGAVEPTSAQQPPAVRRDLFGDALPEGAVARLGTVKLRAAGYHVALMPDGKRLIGVNESLGVREWDAGTGELIQTRHMPGPPHPGDPYGRVFLSPDGSRLASVQLQTIDFWDVAAGVRLHSVPRSAPVAGLRAGTVPQRPAPIVWASFAPDGQLFAAGEHTTHPRFTLVVYDLRNGSRRVVAEVDHSIAHPVFSPNGQRLATNAGKLGYQQVWEVASGRLLWTSATIGLSNRGAAWSPDGRWLVGRAHDILANHAVTVWDADSGRRAPFSTPPPSGFDHRFTQDNRTLVYHTRDGLTFWDLTAGRVTHTIRGVWGPMAFAPDGRSFYPHGLTIQRLDTATGQPLFPDNRADGHTSGVRAAAISPDGRLVASADSFSGARLWDAATGRTLHSFAPDETSGLLVSPAAGVAFTPDGRGLLVQTSAERIRLYDVKDYKELRLFTTATGLIHQFRPTADGKSLIGSTSEGRGGLWRIWDLKTGWLQESNLGSRPTPYGAISADGSTIVESGEVVDVATGRPRLTLTTADQIGQWLAISDDGTRAAVGVFDPNGDREGAFKKPRGVQIWELTTGKPLTHIDCGDTDRTRPVFSPDGRTLATCEADGFRLWDVASGRQVHRQPAHEYQRGVSLAFANVMAFAPDGRTLLTGNHGGTILVWDVATAVHRAGR